MCSSERYAMIAARVLVAVVFMLAGLNVINQAIAAHELAVYGIPAGLIPVMMVGARTLQVIAGTCLILGIYPRIAAFALLLFLVPATLIGHAFWKEIGTALYPVQLINFSKNACMAGGLVFISATKNQPAAVPARTINANCIQRVPKSASAV